jgi:hypothetical protein
LNGIRLIGPVVLNGGALTGNGIIEGDLTNNGALITPGNSPGTIGVAGSFTQTANGSLFLEIGGTNPYAQEFDQLKVGGTAQLGGALSVRTINGFTPESDDRLVPLSFAAVSGEFANTSGNVQLDLASTGAGVTVVGSNPPAPMLVSAASRKTHPGAGAFDIALPIDGPVGVEPRRSTPAESHQIVLTFSEPVTASAVNLTSGTGSVDSFSVNGAEVTVNLNGVIDQQIVTLALTNVSNGTASISPSLSVGFLLGDPSGDGTVNAGDAQGTRNRSGQLAGPGNYKFDVNCDGAINGGDATTVKARSGNTLYP